MRRSYAVALLCAGLLLVSCTRLAPSAGVFQNSTLTALSERAYEGDMTFADLKTHGDFGLGTVNGLDGELLGFDGVFYQVTSDGVVHEIPDNTKTPYATVTFFRPEKTFRVEESLDYAVLQKQLEERLSSKDHIYALRIEAKLRKLKVRSVPVQHSPYPPLSEVIKDEKIWEFEHIEGTLVGYWFPPYLKSLNETGFHLHFLDTKHNAGGHVLDLALQEGMVQIEEVRDYFVRLPAK